MKKGWNLLNAQTIFVVLRAAVLAAGVLGTLVAVWLGCIGVFALTGALEEGMKDIAVMAVTGLVTVVVVSVCCYAMLAVFFRLCGRLGDGHAFTEKNAQAMRIIAVLCAVCGVMIGLADVVMLAVFRTVVLPVVYVGLFAFAFLGVALIAYALCLLVQRAAALQRENELTI